MNILRKLPVGALILVVSASASAEQGVGVGLQSGSASGDSTSTPSLELEYYNLGRNPTERGSVYGLRELKFEWSGADSNGNQTVAFEGRGFSGYQLIGTKTTKTPVMLHLGIEPLNFEGQFDTNFYSDLKNRVTKNIEQGLPPGATQAQINQSLKGSPLGGGNPNAPVMRAHTLYYTPMVSLGVEAKFADACRAIALVRGGAAAGGQLRNDGQSYTYAAPAYGTGVYLNCPGVNFAGEWTRIYQSDAPMDLYNMDMMVKPFSKVPLAVGVELGSTVINSAEPKSVNVLPQHFANGASVERHGGSLARVVF